MTTTVHTGQENAPPSPGLRIWRAHFRIPIGHAKASGSLPSSAPDPNGKEVVVDVVRQEGTTKEEHSYSVLLSTQQRGESHAAADPGTHLHALNCFLAFSNLQEWADRLRELGFHCVEAQIGEAHDPGHSTRLSVRTPFYPSATQPLGVQASGSPSIEYTDLLTLDGLSFSDPAALEPVVAAPLSVAYRQRCTAPDPARPRAELSARETAVPLGVLSMTPLAPDARLRVVSARYPDLASVDGQALEGNTITVGSLSQWPPASPKAAGFPTPTRRLAEMGFGAPTFQFKDVESVGFRIDLSPFRSVADGLLEHLVAPLNFHLEDDGATAVTPFRFKAASRTIVIELLRYGKMMNPDAPELGPDDFTAQHELVLRLLVGRVDDDTSQARFPAVFVPAIFVDNPLSKVFGRELLGYPKRLAHFCAGENRDEIVPMARAFRSSLHERPNEVCAIRALHIVRPIRPMTIIGSPFADKPLVKISCPQDALGDAQFISGQTLRVLRAGSMGPWSQSDFEQSEFRREFARAVVGDGFTSFGSVQVAPVDHRGLPRGWVTGRYTLKDLEIAFPRGIATLEFASPEAFKGEGASEVPEPWLRLCELLHKQPVALPTGDWYRLNCSMDLTIDDLLDP
jgi:hypothetical protein